MRRWMVGRPNRIPCAQEWPESHPWASSIQANGRLVRPPHRRGSQFHVTFFSMGGRRPPGRSTTIPTHRRCSRATAGTLAAISPPLWRRVITTQLLNGIPGSPRQRNGKSSDRKMRTATSRSCATPLSWPAERAPDWSGGWTLDGPFFSRQARDAPVLHAAMRGGRAGGPE